MKIGTFSRTVLLLLCCITGFSMSASAQVQLKHSYTFEDGTANDVIGGASGVVNGGSIADGAYTTTANGEYIDLPAADIAINEYDTITLEAYFSSTSGTFMLAYFGNTTGTFGTDYCFLSSATSKISVSCNNTSQPWTAETNTSGAALNDGELHHVVGVMTADSLWWYIDGASVSRVELTGDNSIANLGTQFAYICKSGYTGDQTWRGTIYEYNIYDGLLSDSVISQRADSSAMVDLKHSYPFDADATDAVGDLDGTLVGEKIAIADGKCVVSGATSNTDGYLTLDGVSLALKEYKAVSLELFFNSTSDGAQGDKYTMLAYFGATAAGTNCLWIQPTRAGQTESRVEANNGASVVAPWATELDDGVKHHVVAILSSDSLMYYVDGVNVSTVATEGDYISTLGTDVAQLFKGPAGWADPNFNGSVEEFNIYEGILGSDFIAARKDFLFAPKSTDNTLASLAVDGGVFDAAFDAATTTYGVSVPTGTTAVDVIASVNDQYATLTGTGTIDVSTGSGVAAIEVTAEDGSVNTYTVTITVDAATTLGFVVDGAVTEYLNTDKKFSVKEYASMYWTGDAAAVLSQTPAVDSVVAGGPITLMAEFDGKVETKLLTLNLIDGSYWIGGESTDFRTAANWGGTQSFANYSRFHVGAIEDSNFECTWSRNGNQTNMSVLDGGKLIIAGGTMNADYLYTYGTGEIVIKGTGALSSRHNYDFNSGTVTLLEGANFNCKSGRVFSMAYDTLTEATLNIFGGTSYITSSIRFGKGMAHINMKDGGLAYFADTATIMAAIDSSYIKPVEDAVLVYDSAAWISSVSFPVPDYRYETLSNADSTFALPDYVEMFMVGDSLNNVTVVQTPAAGTVYTKAPGEMSVVVEATDYFGNVVTKTMTVNLVYGFVWRGTVSSHWTDSANWENGTYPTGGEIFIDKSNEGLYNCDYDSLIASIAWINPVTIMPDNKLTVKVGDFRPSVFDIREGGEYVIDGGSSNSRENLVYINNGTVSLLSHKEGYQWTEFDHRTYMRLAWNAGDSVTLNILGGQANLNGIEVGDGTAKINVGYEGAANFNDSAYVSTLLTSGVITPLDSVFIGADAGLSYIIGTKVIAPEDQRGLVDSEAKFEVPDYTGLVTYSYAAENTITVEQSPAAGTILNEIKEYEVTFTATDAWGNSSFTSCMLDVIDYSVYCPEITTITDENPNDSVAVPDFTVDAETAGLWTGTVTISQIPTAGTLMALDSVFDITITAMDEASNTSECTFTVTVVDTTMPVITVIDDQVLAMNEFCLTNIPDYGTILEVTDGAYKEFTFTQTPVANTQLSTIGEEATVTVYVEDGNGNTSESISFKVTAADVTAPIITKALPGIVPISAATGCEKALPNFIANTNYFDATDYCSSNVTVTQSPEGGYILSGDGDSVEVTITFDDNNGNVSDTTILIQLKAPNCNVGFSNEEVASIKVYPSPASTTLTIDVDGLAGDVTASILDLKGDVVAIYTDLSSPVNVSGLASGIYMVKVVSGSDVAITKFVKE